ncbi:MAG: hypothetical protein V4735_06375 [Pseudomonadota bacterium]
MTSHETTELKLKTTPTGGVQASNSPMYRTLVSQGYKGFLQGTIGGAALYGTLGLAVGGIVAACAFPFVGPLGASVFLLAPAMGGLGILKGASTFGTIGSVAAINAAAADLSEQRRYLLDRYYDLPDGPAGEKEAAAIRQELEQQHTTTKPPHLIHWKTVAICGAIGAAVAVAFLAPIGLGLVTHAGITELLGSTLGTAIVNASVPLLTAVCTGVGALAGATIGIDRYYIRKWFDHTEGVVHSNDHNHGALMERLQQIERLRTAARADERTKEQLLQRAEGDLPMEQAATTPKPRTIASLDQPENKISSMTYENRLADIQKAMAIPAL